MGVQKEMSVGQRLWHERMLLTWSQEKDDANMYALSGLGGIGKTQIAVEYAYCYADDYAAVLWTRAEFIASAWGAVLGAIRYALK